MAKIGILFLNAYEGISKEKIDCTFKIARLEDFLVVAEVASFVGNPLCTLPLDTTKTFCDFLLQSV